MKKLIYLIALIANIQLFAQDVSFMSYYESTEVSPKVGTALVIDFKENAQIGVFYQEQAEMLMDASETSKMPRFYEKEFYGLYMSYPVYSVNKAHVLFNVRTGVTNGQNFIITPSILASYEPIKRIVFNVGVGSRSFRPTLQAGLKIRLASL